MDSVHQPRLPVPLSPVEQVIRLTAAVNLMAQSLGLVGKADQAIASGIRDLAEAMRLLVERQDTLEKKLDRILDPLGH